VQEIGIRRKSDVFLLNSGINIDLLKFTWRNLLLLHGQINCFPNQVFPEQLGKPFSPNPLTPFDQRGWMQGKFMLQGVEAAEILPIGIFDPPLDKGFIGFIEGMFEIEQPDHKPDRECLGSVITAKAVTESCFKAFPVDFVR